MGFLRCEVGVPSGVNIANRRFVVDEVIGSVVAFCTFGAGNLNGGSGSPDTHLFRAQNGKLPRTGVHMTALVTVERDLELAAAHVVAAVIERIRAQGRDAVRDGWPDSVYRASAEAVWTITVPSDSLRVGGIRVVCVSKTTGRVVFDGTVGE